MNVYDSDRMADALAPAGYMPTHAPEDADMIILNTCHIREKASEKVFSELGRLRQVKSRAAEQQNKQVLIAVAGCVAQAEGEEITRRAPWVDMVVGPQTYHRLPELVAQADPYARTHVVDIEFPEEGKKSLKATLSQTGRSTLRVATWLPISMVIGFALMMLWFKKNGGYKPIILAEEK